MKSRAPLAHDSSRTVSIRFSGEEKSLFVPYKEDSP